MARKGNGDKISRKGASLHLRTAIQRKQTGSGETIALAGAGHSSGSNLLVEKVITRPEDNNSIHWKGGVHNEGLVGLDYEGSRPDGLVEIWWSAEQEPPMSDGKWLQLMDWTGIDPQLSLEKEVELGHSLASIA